MRRTRIRSFGTLAAVAGTLLLAGCAATRTPQTAGQGGWQPLFDGSTLTGFVNAAGQPVAAGGWVAENGVLRRAGRGGDLFTAKHYGDFELEWEWKVSEKGNSGVKYRLHRMPNGGWLGPEYQVLDDQGHPDAAMGIGGNRKSASLYDVIAAPADKPLSRVGEWNRSRVVARGDRVEHWLNGTKVVDVDLSSASWRAALATSKFAKEEGVNDWFARQPGPIYFQDHGDEVWYRNIRIRELGPAATRN